jgi:hypothetical protein
MASNMVDLQAQASAPVEPGTRRIIYRRPSRPGMYDPFRELFQKFPGGKFLRCEGGGIAYWLQDCCFLDSGYHILRFDGMAGSWSTDPQTGIEIWTDNTGGKWTKAEFPAFMKDGKGNRLTSGQWYMSTKGQWFLVGLDSKAYTNIFDAFHLKNPMRSVSAELDPTAVPLLNTTPWVSPNRPVDQPGSKEPPSQPESQNPPSQPKPVLKPIEKLEQEDRSRGELLLNKNLSFGTENEALVAFVKQSDYSPLLGLLESTPPVLIVPDSVAEDPEAFIFQSIKSAITGVEDARVFQWKLGPGPRPPEVASENPRFWDWDVVNDLSLQVPPDYAKAYRAVKWYGVEIISPAFRATLDNVDRLRRVIDHLSHKFRFFCPEICGTHVHVARLGNPFSMDDLARIASVTFTAGPLISELHHMSRQNNGFCLPSHRYSYLAKGKTALEACNNEADNSRLKIKAPTPLSNPACVVEPPPRSFMGRSSYLFPRARDRGMLQKREIASMELLLAGVNEIMRCPNEIVLNRLMENAWGMRGAYNFANYKKGIPEDADHLRAFLSKQNPTVEFREAAGMMNADNLVTWVTIVLNLTSVAVLTSMDSLSCFFQRSAAGAQDPAVYDVFDLLIDLHLPRTACYVQSTLFGSGNNSLPCEFLGPM